MMRQGGMGDRACLQQGIVPAGLKQIGNLNENATLLPAVDVQALEVANKELIAAHREVGPR